MAEAHSYYRHRESGDRGYLVNREGKHFIRLDRPSEVIERPFRETDWIPEVEHRPMSDHDRARVCFGADRELCRSLGLYDKARLDWMSLPDRARIAWIEEGPAEPIRRKLYIGIQALLAED